MRSVYAQIAIASLGVTLFVSFLALPKNESWATNSFNIPLLVSVLWGILQTT